MIEFNDFNKPSLSVGYDNLKGEFDWHCATDGNAFHTIFSTYVN